MPVTILCVPVDVLEQHILALLSPASLMACLFTCRRLNRLATRALKSKHEKKYLQTALQDFSSLQIWVLRSLFEEGAPVALLEWFRNHLNYKLDHNVSCSISETLLFK